MLFYNEILKVTIQLFILGILGGGITWFYAKIQKNRDIRIKLIQEFARIQGDFLTIRYEFNTFYLKRGTDEIMPIIINLPELETLKWQKYEKACSLLGEFQSIKPLLVEFYPSCLDNINFVHSKYQDWRRQMRNDKPILQDIEGNSSGELKKLKVAYYETIILMRQKI